MAATADVSAALRVPKPSLIFLIERISYSTGGKMNVLYLILLSLVFSVARYQLALH